MCETCFNEGLIVMLQIFSAYSLINNHEGTEQTVFSARRVSLASLSYSFSSKGLNKTNQIHLLNFSSKLGGSPDL